ncbi:MAG: proline--tRNA ligase, partial [Alphaproteobacteria bacterium]|nr:proline--tRNA ligase [Alphaproteobacteria bacterium]
SRLVHEDGKLPPSSPWDDPLIVRPPSAPILADSCAKWVNSDRDLPILLNQWANLVRWVMRPRLFLRTREFFWQEGHTVLATHKEAEAETVKMLEVYRDFAENALAMPVIVGRKPEYDKFPGALDTYCIEAMMQDGKALQAGTSHFLGQNFAKSANIKFVNQNNEQEFAYTTSWGVSTRLIGGTIMCHADDDGMVVPPLVAPYQVIFVPLIKKPEDEEKVMAYIKDIQNRLKAQTAFGEKLRIKVDTRNKSSVDKVWEWVRKGAPIVCEIGPRDIEKGGLMAKERIFIGQPEGKKLLSVDEFVANVGKRLEGLQAEMFKRAKQRLDMNVRTDITTPEQFAAYFANANEWIEDGKAGKVAFVRGKWCGDAATEEILKAMKITIRCVPFDQSGTTGKCLLTGKDATMDVIYARSY